MEEDSHVHVFSTECECIDRRSLKPINGFRTDSKFGSFVVSFKSPTFSDLVAPL